MIPQAVQKLNQRLSLFPWLGVSTGTGAQSTHCKLCGSEELVPWRNLQQLREHEDSQEHCARAKVCVSDLYLQYIDLDGSESGSGSRSNQGVA